MPKNEIPSKYSFWSPHNPKNKNHECLFDTSNTLMTLTVVVFPKCMYVVQMQILIFLPLRQEIRASARLGGAACLSFTA